MYKFGYNHDARGRDVGVPAVVFYEEKAFWRWRDLLRLWRKPTCVYILENVRFTSIPREPHLRDKASITIDGQDVYALLESMGMKGLIKLKCAAAHGPGNYVKNGRVYLTDSNCRLRLGFTDKQSAMMAKLAWGGTGLTW